MEQNSAELPERKSRERPIMLTFHRRDKMVRAKLAPKPEGLDEKKYPDPFIALNQETGGLVRLTSHQRLMAYQQLGITAPDELREGLNRYHQIRIRKEKEIHPKA